MQRSNTYPVQVAVCATSDQAWWAINDLEQAGFTSEEVSVICRDEACRREFADYIPELPAASRGTGSLSKAGFGAISLGAAAVIAAFLAYQGAALFAMGAFAGLAIAGVFAAMLMRVGVGSTRARQYERLLAKGRLLVVVETDDAVRMRRADEILDRQEAFRETVLSDVSTGS